MIFMRFVLVEVEFLIFDIESNYDFIVGSYTIVRSWFSWAILPSGR